MTGIPSMIALPSQSGSSVGARKTTVAVQEIDERRRFSIAQEIAKGDLPYWLTRTRSNEAGNAELLSLRIKRTSVLVEGNIPRAVCLAWSSLGVATYQTGK